MTQVLHEGRYDQTKQFISFNNGKASIAPDPALYPIHVLTGDTFLYQIDGGFPDEPVEPFITDPIVYPSSEYWQTLLSGDRVRPYIDLSISEYNTLRLPSAIHEYDLFCDNATFYEDVVIEGSIEIGGTGGASIGSQNITIPGDINCSDITCDSITTDVINEAVAKTRIPIISITADKTLANPDTGSVIHCSPDGANINISLPNGLQTGFVVTITNLLPGKTTTLPTTLKARGNVLSEPYSAATIYFDGSDWYGYGDLV